MASVTSLPPAGNSLSSRNLRRIILAQSKRANVGHVGSSLSIADLIAVLYGDVLNIPSPEDPERDRFVLSKGHAALALYAAFHLKGWLAVGQIEMFCASNSILGVHPEHCLLGVDFSTGSLGMGLGYAAGAALAARMQGSSRRAFALLSDAECNEGSVWEAAMVGAHHRLANLTAVIDCNGQQALGYTKDVLNAERLAERWEAFDWDVHTVDGHDVAALRDTFANLDYCSGRPHLILAKTVFGRGVSFMEGKIKWHYWPMDEMEYAQAMHEVEGGRP
jgi:transketolase